MVNRVIAPLVTYDPEEEVGKIDYEDVLASDIVRFQHGTVGANGINGCQSEDVLRLLILRLRHLNEKLPCRENSLAITKIQEALFWLEYRTKLRMEQGIEGQEIAHVSP